jgi:hypothetical protein
MMSKRLWTLPVLAAFVVAAAGGSAFAIPSLGGPTGIVSLPTADVAPMDSLGLALTYQSLDVGDLADDYTVWGLQALAGVSEEAELWAAYSTVRNTDDTHVWGIGGKYLFAKEPEDSANLAIGGSWEQWADAVAETVVTAGDMYTPEVIESVTTDVTFKKVYLVATKDFTPLGGEAWEWSSGAGTRMLGTLGVIYIDVDPDAGEGDSLTRPFLGVEFIGEEGTTLGLEYRWKDDDLDQKAVFSAVLRHPFSPEVAAEVGTTNASPGGLGLDGQDWFVRVAYMVPLT